MSMSGGGDGGHRSWKRFQFALELGGDDPGCERRNRDVTSGTESAQDIGDAEAVFLHWTRYRAHWWGQSQGSPRPGFCRPWSGHWLSCSFIWRGEYRLRKGPDHCRQPLWLHGSDSFSRTSWTSKRWGAWRGRGPRVRLPQPWSCDGCCDGVPNFGEVIYWAFESEQMDITKLQIFSGAWARDALRPIGENPSTIRRRVGLLAWIHCRWVPRR